MSSTKHTSGGAAGRKALLFCPACEYEAPIDGEWSLEGRDGSDGCRTDIACPECGHVVVSQPRFRSRPTAVAP